jgi:DNA-binding transcriptional LysR family regulator
MRRPIMEMHQIRYLLAVCRTYNFTRAARHCGVSQPSLTKAIKALEQELGGRLFHRDRRGVRLTGTGARLRPYFEEIARLVAAIQEDVAERATTPPVADFVPRLSSDIHTVNAVTPATIHNDGREALDEVPAE